MNECRLWTYRTYEGTAREQVKQMIMPFGMLCEVHERPLAMCAQARQMAELKAAVRNLTRTLYRGRGVAPFGGVIEGSPIALAVHRVEALLAKEEEP